MTQHGGRRPGAGRPRSAGKQGVALWVPGTTEEVEAYKHLTPDERRAALLAAIQEKESAMNRTYTYTREEIVAAAQAALRNWDFGEWPQYEQPLRDIVDGADDIGTDEPVTVTRAYTDRETALLHWLEDYADQPDSPAEGEHR